MKTGLPHLRRGSIAAKVGFIHSQQRLGVGWPQGLDSEAWDPCHHRVTLSPCPFASPLLSQCWWLFSLPQFPTPRPRSRLKTSNSISRSNPLPPPITASSPSMPTTSAPARPPHSPQIFP